MEISAVCLDMKSSTLEGAIQEMVGELDLPDQKKEKITAEVIERERKASTNIGDQIALPHCKTKEASGVIVVFGRMAEPIQQAEGKSVKLIFLIISSVKEIRGHLRVLAQLSRALKSKDNQQALLSIASKAAVEEILDGD